MGASGLFLSVLAFLYQRLIMSLVVLRIHSCDGTNKKRANCFKCYELSINLTERQSSLLMYLHLIIFLSHEITYTQFINCVKVRYTRVQALFSQWEYCIGFYYCLSDFSACLTTLASCHWFICEMGLLSLTSKLVCYNILQQFSAPFLSLLSHRQSQPTL